MELKSGLLVIAVCVAIHFIAHKALSRSSNPKGEPTIEAFLLLESESGIQGEFSLGMKQSMSECRDLGSFEAAEDVDGYWIDPTFSEIGGQDSGWAFYKITGFVCRQ